MNKVCTGARALGKRVWGVCQQKRVVQACAAFPPTLTFPIYKRNHLHRLGKVGLRTRTELLFLPRGNGCLPHRAFQAVVGSSKFSFSYYITGILILIGTLLGRFVCGFLCPFGWVQDLLNKIPFPKVQYKKAQVVAVCEIWHFDRDGLGASGTAAKCRGHGRSLFLQVRMPARHT